MFFSLVPIQKSWREPHADQTKFCSKKENEFVAHPEDCSKYFVCNGFKGFEIQCPDGYHFDNFLKICNPASEVRCQKSDTKEITKEKSGPSIVVRGGELIILNSRAKRDSGDLEEKSKENSTTGNLFSKATFSTVKVLANFLNYSHS